MGDFLSEQAATATFDSIGVSAGTVLPGRSSDASGRARVEQSAVLLGDSDDRPQPEPLFLLSLPRAGSTLLQRLLGAHPEIATTGEPWLALPLLYSLRERGVDAEYGHATAARSIARFCDQLPRAREQYLEAARAFLERLYGAAGAGRTYFLDKSPPYHFVAAELLELFPDARLIFLWRNPLGVAASLIDSWNRGRWNLDVHATALFGGVERLTAAWTAAGDRAIGVRFEDLVSRPEAELARLVSWLRLPPCSTLVRDFVGVRFPTGDAQGTTRYGTVSAEPIDKWKETLANPLRKLWARRYLHWIGAERLAIQGYDLAGLLAEVDAIPTGRAHLGGDVARNLYAGLVRSLAAAAVSRRRLAWPRGETGWR